MTHKHLIHANMALFMCVYIYIYVCVCVYISKSPLDCKKSITPASRKSAKSTKGLLLHLQWNLMD